MRKFRLIIKHTLDFLGALVLVVLLSPLFAVIALAIWADDRLPVMFSQSRLGKSGVSFRIWKFRTMINDADQYLSGDGIATRNRITRVGKFLRFLSLDELPQLFNILKGEMSFIGPRPALVEHGERYSEVQRNRLIMRPGVTGLAQVRGRNTLKWSQRIKYDIEYIEQYTLFLDLKILLNTIAVVVLRQGIVLDRNADEVDDLSK